VTGAVVEDQPAASVRLEHDLFCIAAGVDRDRAVADDGPPAADEAAARDVDEAARTANSSPVVLRVSLPSISAVPPASARNVPPDETMPLPP
jgi:hypothetical protein